MKINKLSLPHPVLGLGDDVTGDYVASMDVVMGKDNILLNITNSLSNKSLEEMITIGDANFCVDVNCRKTLFRQTYSTQNLRQQIKIDSGFLRDKVLVSFYILAVNDIKNFAPTGTNSDYEGRFFSVRAGDVLGYGGDSEFIASKRWEDQRGISSFLVIRPGENKKGPYSIDLNCNKIVVTLNKEDYASFRTASESGFDDIFLTSIVLPVLIYALNQMRENDELYGDWSWYQLLDFRIKNDKELGSLEFEPENIPNIAQLLLANPLGRTLLKLNSLIENSFEVE